MNRQRILQLVSQHPMNRSKTKEAHAFNKAQRFPRHHQSTCIQSNDTITYYSPTKSNKNSAHKFPHQRRFRLRDEEQRRKSLTPSPQHYDSSFSPSKSQGKGISFTRARKENKKEEYTPGPGEYESQQYISTYFSRSKGKMKFRTSSEWNIHANSREVQNQQSFNQLHSPRFGHAKGAVIGCSKRFKQTMDRTSSPTYYDSYQAALPSFGTRNSKGVSFTKSKRKGFLDQNRLKQQSETPGPGYYENDFSQFSEGSKRILQRLMKL